MGPPDSAFDDPGPSRRTFALALTAITVVALAVRVWQATRTGLWFDEIFTLWVARLDWHGLAATVARDVHPPLHFAIVKLWRALGGESSVWIKLSSVLPGTALVVVTGLFGRAMFGPRAGLIAAALMALHGDMVMFSQEARSYVWLALAIWLAVGFAWSWVTTPRAAAAVGFVLAEALGLWSHYLAGLVFALLFGWGLVALRRSPRRIAQWVGLHLAVAALFAPQVPTFLAQYRHQQTDHWVRHAVWGDLFALARHSAFASAVLLVPFALLAVMPLTRPYRRLHALLPLSLIVAAVGIAFALTRAGGHVFTERYMHWVVPGLLMLVGSGLDMVRRGWLRWSLAALFLVQGARVIALSPQSEAGDQAAVQRWLETHVRAGDAIVCGDSHSWLYLSQHAPKLPPAVLLWPEGELPYYEGSLVIPPAAIHRAGALDSLRAAGMSWWAVRSEHGGIDTAPAAALIERAGGRVVMTAGETRVYRGGAATATGDSR